MDNRKIPKAALSDLAEMCQFLGKHYGEPAADFLKLNLGLMEKYDYYFFNEKWPQEYNFEHATTFTNEDQDFLFTDKEDFTERLETVSLKKNIYMNGFMGIMGMFWTRQAYHEQFVRPKLKPVSEAFLKYAESSDDPQEVLGKVKNEFQGLKVEFIHDALVDYRETNYPDKQKDKLLANILEITHTVEGLPECGEYMCKLKRDLLKRTEPSPYAC